MKKKRKQTIQVKKAHQGEGEWDREVGQQAGEQQTGRKGETEGPKGKQSLYSTAHITEGNTNPQGTIE